MVGITVGGRPLAGFDQPIELLKDCHRRIEHFLGVLQVMVERFGAGLLPDEGRRGLEAALDYFSHSAPRHTSDEEQSLFPRMRQGTNAQARAVMDELDRLEGDHRRADARHDQVDKLGRAWLATGYLDESQRTTMRVLLNELVALYTAHIRLEEERVFEVAAETLTASELAEVGVEMRQRRFGS
jgi:iron-sulfur cluster repair protein YtfE (RIC family)